MTAENAAQKQSFKAYILMTKNIKLDALMQGRLITILQSTVKHS